jgi:pseudoazurin
VKRTALKSGIAIGILLSASSAWAADYRIEMLNKDSEGRTMQFEPAYLKIEPGDTVTFVPTDKGHNSQSIPDMIPAEADPWKGKINEEITVTYDQEGFYAFKCQPHLGLGMVGLIEVGDGGPRIAAEVIDKLPGRAADRMAELIAQADQEGEEPPDVDDKPQ